jgi:WD40 repeat protein/predicted Ser/Thr protein kinase
VPANDPNPSTDLVPTDPAGNTLNGTGPHHAPASETVGQSPSVAQQLVRQLTPGGRAASASPFPTVPGYVVTRELARGGMGVVYAARDPVFDREVAIKVMHPGQDAGRFVVEAQVTARLPHPGVPPVYTLGTLPDGRPFLAMKLIDGRTLADELEAAGPADLPRLLGVLERICQTVGFAHARGIVHRDLKPSNVMVGSFGAVLVLDWGLAKEIDPCLPAEPPRGRRKDYEETLAGQVKGTPAFMAPEQARGEPVDARTDVFSLGGILAVLLTGRPPFVGNSVFDTVIRAAQAELSECFALLESSGADPELIALAERCLSAAPAERPANGAQVAEAVAGYRAGVEERLRRAERERAAAAERRKRRRVQSALVGAILLLVTAGLLGGALAGLWRTAERAKDEAELARGAAETARDQLADEKKLSEAARDQAVQLRGAAETARDQLAAEKKLSEAARDQAVELRAAAEKAREGEADARRAVEQEREKLAVLEYGRAMEVAYQEWRENNVASTVALLAGTRPDLRGWEWQFVNRLCHTDLLTLAGHTERLLSAAFSPNGARVVTGGLDKTARVWDAATGKELLTLTGHTAAVNSVSFSRDGTRIVTGGGDKTAKVWDANTGKELLTLTGHTGDVTSAAFSPNGARIVTGSTDKTAVVWDAKNGKELFALRGHKERVLSAAFSHDGTRIVTGSWDKTAKVWEVPAAKPEGFAAAAKELLTLTGHTAGVSSAAFSPDRARIVTGGWDHTARVWDAATGKAQSALDGHTNVVTSVSFSPDGASILTGSWDQTARVWEVPSAKPEGFATNPKERLTLKGHTRQVSSAAFSPDGEKVVTAGWDLTAKVWEVPPARAEGLATNPKERLALKGHPGDINLRVLSSDGVRVLTVNPDQIRTAKVWDTTTGKDLFTVRHANTVTIASFRPDGQQFITGSADRTAKVWDANTGKELLTLAHPGVVYAAALSADGTRAVTGCADKAVRVWDAISGRELHTLSGHTDAVSFAGFSPDGARIVTGSADQTARVWDATTGAERLTLAGHKERVASAGFSPDGTRLLTSTPTRVVKMWDLGTGKELFPHLAFSGRASAASFSPDGSRFVTASGGRVGRVRDVRTGKEVCSLRGHTGDVWSAAYSPDGKRIVTGSSDQTAKVWDADTGAELLTLRGYLPVLNVTFSPDGTRIVAASSTATLVWDARPVDRAVPAPEPPPPLK